MTKKFSLSARLASFRYAFHGLRTMLVEEHNSRIHLLATIAVIAVGIASEIGADEWRWVILAVGLVWLAEAFNTAIERLGEAISVECHPKIGTAKDVAAAGVLVSSLLATFIGLSVFLPHVSRWIAR